MKENLPAVQQSMSPSTFAEAQAFAVMISKTDFAPKDYRGKPENCLVAIVYGNEIGLSPVQSLQNIAVVNGRPSIYGDAAMALVLASPVCEYVRESYDMKSMTATCRAKRRGHQEHVQEFSKEDAQKAGLWGKGGPWTQYPQRMLAMRARGFALRNVFADVLKGIITREEAMDYPTEEAVLVKPSETKAAAVVDIPQKEEKKVEVKRPKVEPAAPPPPEPPPFVDAEIFDGPPFPAEVEPEPVTIETLKAAFSVAMKIHGLDKVRARLTENGMPVVAKDISQEDYVAVVGILKDMATEVPA